MNLPRLLLVTDRRRVGGDRFLDGVCRAVEGGVRFVRIREPDLSDRQLERAVRTLREVLPDDGVVVVDGPPERAAALGCGTHVPARSIATWRATSMRPRPFGTSAHDAREVAVALRAAPDYVLLGTAFPTGSKPGHTGLGVRGIGELGDACGANPSYAIGGVTLDRASALLEGGKVFGVSVTAAILDAPDPKAAAAMWCVRIASVSHVATS